MPPYISLKATRRDRSFQSGSTAVHSDAASPNRTLRFALLSGLLLVALGSAMPARADIWGYVDENGRAHMASEKLDSRYTLFFKGTQRIGGPASPAPSAGAAESVAVSFVDSAAEAFRNSDKFKRTTAQSNVKKFEPLIEQAAKLHKVDPALVKAVVAVESSFQPDAVSPKGARGLMQVIPDTAERYGIVGDRKTSAEQKLLDPATNLQVGSQHLSMLMSMFASNLELVLAAYNAGEGAVLKYAKKIPPYRETQEYVKLVKQFYAGFSPASKTEPKPVQVAQAAPQKMSIQWSQTPAPTIPAPVAVPAAMIAPAAYTPSPAAASAVQHPAPAETGTAPAAGEPAALSPVFRPVTTDTHEPKPESVLGIS